MSEARSNRATTLATFLELQHRAKDVIVPSDGYVVSAVERRDDLFLGCSSNGDLALLVVTKPSNTLPPPVRLAALRADFGASSVLSENGAERTLRVSSLRCTTSERNVADLFATVCGALADALPGKPTGREFSDEIARWAGLFWRLGQRVETDVVGLAGELTAISNVEDPGPWLEAWHADPGDVLDFIFPNGAAVEVKTTRSSRREHTVSLGQVLEPGLARRFFVSVQIDLTDSGQSLGDLVRELSDRVDSDQARLKLWNVLSRTCGSGLDAALDRRLDISKALASIRVCRAESIPTPHIGLPLPQGVSSVKFTSDFSLAAAVTTEQLEAEVHAP